MADLPIVLPHGGYKKLVSYRKSDTIYQGTVVFCRRFLPKFGDRTVDQMVQAARSCKQNIAEGSASSGTSKETEIKLTNVARASLDELFEDYEDYLKANGPFALDLNGQARVGLVRRVGRVIGEGGADSFSRTFPTCHTAPTGSTTPTSSTTPTRPTKSAGVSRLIGRLVK